MGARRDHSLGEVGWGTIPSYRTLRPPPEREPPIPRARMWRTCGGYPRPYRRHRRLPRGEGVDLAARRALPGGSPTHYPLSSGIGTWEGGYGTRPRFGPDFGGHPPRLTRRIHPGIPQGYGAPGAMAERHGGGEATRPQRR